MQFPRMLEIQNYKEVKNERRMKKEELERKCQYPGNEIEEMGDTEPFDVV